VCDLSAVPVAGGKSLCLSPHLLTSVGQFSLISPSLTHQPNVRLRPQPLNQSLCTLFSLDCTRPVSSALGLRSSLTRQLVLLVLSLLPFPPESQHPLPVHPCMLSCQPGRWRAVPVSSSCLASLAPFLLGHSWEAC